MELEQVESDGLWYARVFRSGIDGRIMVGCWEWGEMFNWQLVMPDTPIIACDMSDWFKYRERADALANDDGFLFTAWFLVRASDTITRDEIAEAVKWG